jgi:hypothetical protein
LTIDIHNSLHPQTKNGGHNALSFVFTGHYMAMKTRFGDRLPIGCAGENILVESDGLVSLDQVSRGVVIETSQGKISLGNVIVAAPCRSFSKFALASAAADPAGVKEALQFLDKGMRGFYCSLLDELPATVRLGDRVFAV